MKKKDNKLTQEQIDTARQKKLMSSGYKSTVKRFIESINTYNITCRKSTLLGSEIRKLAKYFAERVDVSSHRSKEPVAESADEIVPKKSLKY